MPRNKVGDHGPPGTFGLDGSLFPLLPPSAVACCGGRVASRAMTEGVFLTFYDFIMVVLPTRIRYDVFMETRPSILVLSEHDEDKELEFELEYLRSLTFEDRLELMRKKSKEMLRQMVELGYRKPFEILKRP
jgi:hypothetical protein